MPFTSCQSWQIGRRTHIRWKSWRLRWRPRAKRRVQRKKSMSTILQSIKPIKLNLSAKSWRNWNGTAPFMRRETQIHSIESKESKTCSAPMLTIRKKDGEKKRWCWLPSQHARSIYAVHELLTRKTSIVSMFYLQWTDELAWEPAPISLWYSGFAWRAAWTSRNIIRKVAILSGQCTGNGKKKMTKKYGGCLAGDARA